MDVTIGRELTMKAAAESGSKFLMGLIATILTVGVVGFSILVGGLILVIGGIYHCGMTAYRTIRRLLNG